MGKGRRNALLTLPSQGAYEFLHALGQVLPTHAALAKAKAIPWGITQNVLRRQKHSHLSGRYLGLHEEAARQRA
jgi:hypothetical protein